ncbi:YkgJ family cysteine cluster protein [Salinispira pacifica]|uniref:YkgJ family cysteine cluster protein n=1 Tax=Salinispira pacifica TaxID=1307761 RepID=V5WH43_9SPIO|nr:YkgJ family cysteine cluster protein [Salinispira pacifica]AHC15142.1 hypothetical protein L21SP2_1765 [Salinispira pacifica]
MNEQWYAPGVNFSCTRCSRCCRHDSGYVFLSEDDIRTLRHHLSLSRKDFIQQYCTVVDFSVAKRVSLKEQENFDCIFWKDGGCSVYEARPLQCRAYPFWERHMESKKDWDALEHECPGINAGAHHSREEIEDWLRARKNSPLTERG